MNPLRLPLLAAFVVTSLAGGATFGCNRSGAMLREAASADLHCPKNRIHVIGASKTKDVEACGQRATYRFEDGDWVMISREGAAPAGQPGQPQSSVKAGPPGVAPAQPASTMTGTPSMPPSSPPPPPPPAPGQKAL